jgi:hypothetical protein
VQLRDFNWGIILVSPHVDQPIIDYRTGRITESSLRISKAQELQQECWAYRFSCPASSVTVYRTATSRFDDSVLGMRTKVDNEQLAGFLAALSGSKAGFTPVAKCALSMLVGPDLLRERLSQLDQMGICRMSNASFDGQLTGTTRSAFYELLPMFNYDPRLALFVAMSCDSLAVVNVKIQIAALFSVGILNIFKFDIDPDSDLAEFMKRLEGEVYHGYTKEYAPLGSMLALVAIWKKVALQCANFDPENISLTTAINLGVCDGKMFVTVQGSQFALQLMLQVSEILKARQDIAPEPTEFEKESSWTMDCLMEFQSHLMRCFAHSTVIAVEVPSEIEARWYFIDRGSLTQLSSSPWLSMIEYKKAVRAGEDGGRPMNMPLLGVSLTAVQAPAKDQEDMSPYILDWTWIHPGIVHEWRQRHANGRSNATVRRVRFGQNPDTL